VLGLQGPRPRQGAGLVAPLQGDVHRMAGVGFQTAERRGALVALVGSARRGRRWPWVRRAPHSQVRVARRACWAPSSSASRDRRSTASRPERLPARPSLRAAPRSRTVRARDAFRCPPSRGTNSGLREQAMFLRQCPRRVQQWTIGRATFGKQRGDSASRCVGSGAGEPGFDDGLQARARQRAAGIGVMAKALPLCHIVFEGRGVGTAHNGERQGASRTGPCLSADGRRHYFPGRQMARHGAHPLPRTRRGARRSP
jgi:hypothetical protein